MSAGFSPGPWEVLQTPDLLKVITALDGDVDGDTGQHIIVGGDTVALISEHDEANARLIAKAPDMYAALIEIAKYADLSDEHIALIAELGGEA